MFAKAVLNENEAYRLTVDKAGVHACEGVSTSIFMALQAAGRCTLQYLGDAPNQINPPSPFFLLP